MGPNVDMSRSIFELTAEFSTKLVSASLSAVSKGSAHWTAHTDIPRMNVCAQPRNAIRG